MCTTIILYRKDSSWPLIIGSNRDEKLDRKSLFPGRHWIKNHPNIIGGYDELKGGTWIAINDNGIFSVIHNRELIEDNKFKKKTRGNIILELLKHNSIDESINYLRYLNQKLYNGFNIVLGNIERCIWAKHESINKKITINEVPEGLSVLTDKDLNDISDKKTRYYLNKLSQSPIPDLNNNNWLSWELLLSTNKIEQQEKVYESICFFDKENNFGTRSSSLVALSNKISLNYIKNDVIFKSTNESPLNSNYIDVEID